jgi:hypothetical protein
MSGVPGRNGDEDGPFLSNRPVAAARVQLLTSYNVSRGSRRFRRPVRSLSFLILHITKCDSRVLTPSCGTRFGKRRRLLATRNGLSAILASAMSPPRTTATTAIASISRWIVKRFMAGLPPNLPSFLPLGSAWQVSFQPSLRADTAINGKRVASDVAGLIGK